jgi:hypothetical protein
LEICNEVEKRFVVIYKKRLTKHGGQVIKQVLKPKSIFESLVLSKPITWENSQHNGIGSHLFYLKLQHRNVSLSFDKIQLTIVKCLQSTSLISNVQLKHVSIYLSIPNIPKVSNFSNKNIMSPSYFNILSVPCFSHVSTFYHFVFQHSINSKETCYNTSE